MRAIMDRQTCITNLQGTKDGQVPLRRLTLAVIEQVDFGDDDLAMTTVRRISLSPGKPQNHTAHTHLFVLCRIAASVGRSRGSVSAKLLIKPPMTIRRTCPHFSESFTFTYSPNGPTGGCPCHRAERMAWRTASMWFPNCATLLFSISPHRRICSSHSTMRWRIWAWSSCSRRISFSDASASPKRRSFSLVACFCFASLSASSALASWSCAVVLSRLPRERVSARACSSVICFSSPAMVALTPAKESLICFSSL